MKAVHPLRFALVALALPASLSAAQAAPQTASPPRAHHVLFAVTSGDKADWGLTLGNVRKIMSTLPAGTVDIEVVGWGASVTLLQKGSEEEKNIAELEGPHVHFVACEFSLNNRKLTRADVLPGVETVPVGVVEAVTRQEQGWSYIKGGR